MKIIAIGGGGFTHESFAELDDFCLEQAGRTRPRMGFIGAASGDDPVKSARFHRRFEPLAGCTVDLPMSLSTAELATRLAGLDMVYVGGGDTEAMVALWRRNGWDRVLHRAARDGLCLAGVSAGAMCWFERFLFSSGAGPMRPVPGLGLIPGGCCPHYSTEPERRAALHAAVAAGAMPASIAIDDGVAVAFDDAWPVAICAAVNGAGAYRIEVGPEGCREAALAVS